MTQEQITPDLRARLDAVVKQVEEQKAHCTDEQRTKNALIEPFLERFLGFDTRNLTEVQPEFIADVGIKRGEKVDYAILRDNKPLILVEAKKYDVTLSLEHASQLTRYFNNTDAVVAILTDGVEYRFYSDFDKRNIMDRTPFFTFNVLSHTEADIHVIARFTRSRVYGGNLRESIREYKLERDREEDIRSLIISEFENPSVEMARVFFQKSRLFEGRFGKDNQTLVKRMVRSAFAQIIEEKVQERQAGQQRGAEASVAPPSVQTQPVESAGRGGSRRKRNPRFNFFKMGIPQGSELVYRNGDISATAKVRSETRVELQGRTMSLSEASEVLTGRWHDPRDFWTYNGRALDDLYRENQLGVGGAT